MAAYIDGRLSGYRQTELDEHVSRCISCFECYEAVLRFKLEEDTP